jgi:hypothetical protein
MLTRSQTVLVNNYFEDNGLPMVLRNGTTVPRASAGPNVSTSATSGPGAVRTRSQTKVLDQIQAQHDAVSRVDIDFDEASRAWTKNKRSTGHGTYAYTH